MDRRENGRDRGEGSEYTDGDGRELDLDGGGDARDGGWQYGG